MPARKSGYRNVSFPAEMIAEIETVIKEHPEWGYTSVAEFVKESIRRHRDHMLRLEAWGVSEPDTKSRPSQ